MVGKYVQIRDSYMSLHEALMHGGLKTPHARQHPLHRVHRHRAARHRTCSSGMDAILVPGGFGERGIEGKIQAVRYRARARRALPRHLPRHAGGDRRVRPPRARARGRQQHRVQSRHAPSGDRADHRVAGPGARRADARRGSRQGRHDAPGRAGGAARRRHARPRDLRHAT